ncbi:unnamed protein product [Microthlaspi erraticum]|uniref:Uncharacterized protein n=1 Tax=Microthlaspi erraticum TaxID=1685480 RepID=A0A6D2JKN8_9BRAS|nr:unnamed protein product [Microthlaspi erraticum]
MFHKCAATKLIDMISRVKERGQQPYWILDDYYKDLVECKAKAKERSKKASKSRMSDRNGLGPHKHRAGSRSYAKVADLLKKKTGDASYIEVLRETHKKRDGSFVDERARLISEGFDKDLADHIVDDEFPTGEEPTPQKKNEMYLKCSVCGGACGLVPDGSGGGGGSCSPLQADARGVEALTSGCSDLRLKTVGQKCYELRYYEMFSVYQGFLRPERIGVEFRVL